MKVQASIFLLLILHLMGCSGESQPSETPTLEVQSNFSRRDFKASWQGFLDEEIPITLELDHRDGQVQGVLVFDKTQTRYPCTGNLSPMGELDLRFSNANGQAEAELDAYLRNENEIEGAYHPVEGLEALYLFVAQDPTTKMKGPGQTQEDQVPGLERWRHRVYLQDSGQQVLLEFPQIQGKERFNRILRAKFLRERIILPEWLNAERQLFGYRLVHHSDNVFSFLLTHPDSLQDYACNFFADGDQAWFMPMSEQFNSLDKIRELIQERKKLDNNSPFSYYLEASDIVFMVMTQNGTKIEQISMSLREIWPHVHPGSPLQNLIKTQNL